MRPYGTEHALPPPKKEAKEQERSDIFRTLDHPDHPKAVVRDAAYYEDWPPLLRPKEFQPQLQDGFGSIDPELFSPKSRPRSVAAHEGSGGDVEYLMHNWPSKQRSLTTAMQMPPKSTKAARKHRSVYRASGAYHSYAYNRPRPEGFRPTASQLDRSI